MTRRSGWTLPALADAYLAGGARFIQIRSKHAASGAFLEMCEDVVARGRKANAIVIVNDRADIARLSAADGVHVGQDDLDPVSVRRILGDAAIVGLSTHSVEQVVAAARPEAQFPSTDLTERLTIHRFVAVRTTPPPWRAFECD